MRPDEPTEPPLRIPRPRAVNSDDRLVEAARLGRLPVADQDPLVRLLAALHDARRTTSGRG